jgi:hypothetical protein
VCVKKKDNNNIKSEITIKKVREKKFLKKKSVFFFSFDIYFSFFLVYFLFFSVLLKFKQKSKNFEKERSSQSESVI